MKRLLFSILIVIFAAGITAAQDNSQILNRIESTVTQNLPGFTLKHRIPADRNAAYIWVRERDFVFVWIEFHQTTNLARSAFVSAPWVAQSEGMGQVSVPDERISGLGYDNYWSEGVADKKKGLHFYRGHISVIVTAPSNETALRVAKQVDLLLPDA